jgi:flagellar motility protein MotE (MotC chaperone)
MKSVLLFSGLSFLVIFIVVFIVTGVFSGSIKAWKQSHPVEEEVVEEVLDEGDLERQSLNARSAEIARREEILGDSEEALELEKAVLAEEFNKLNAMRKRIDRAAGQVDAVKAKTLKKMAKMYEAMPAKDAATILSGMDVDIVLSLLKLMKERPAAKIMAALDPARAAAMSNMMTITREK